ncbi:13-hydroxylupanine O-tigloyltransferase-like [Durio zibethinus]|uniref:13-hydroxylupanine O-tigloyltransferase-like n=1 Tax=Durio zibethinus TaxID=66656 RepID=A0A6P5Y7Q4_DURZI|nr:13-hydroxylupanine O-tigloyltransferase-like [Durio zibethinus]
MIDCTAEGLLFIEANADISLDQLGNTLQPPFPYVDLVLFDVPASSGVLGCPLLLIQLQVPQLIDIVENNAVQKMQNVTRLICGGFIFAVRLNHAICDLIGSICSISEHHWSDGKSGKQTISATCTAKSDL